MADAGSSEEQGLAAVDQGSLTRVSGLRLIPHPHPTKEEQGR